MNVFEVLLCIMTFLVCRKVVCAIDSFAVVLDRFVDRIRKSDKQMEGRLRKQQKESDRTRD